MDVITAASANCTTVQFSAGQERATVELQLNPHTGLRTDSNNEIVLSLPNPEDTEGYDGYTVDTARDTLTAFIEEEQVQNYRWFLARPRALMVKVGCTVQQQPRCLAC